MGCGPPLLFCTCEDAVMPAPRNQEKEADPSCLVCLFQLRTQGPEIQSRRCHDWKTPSN